MNRQLNGKAFESLARDLVEIDCSNRETNAELQEELRSLNGVDRACLGAYVNGARYERERQAEIAARAAEVHMQTSALESTPDLVASWQRRAAAIERRERFRPWLIAAFTLMIFTFAVLAVKVSNDRAINDLRMERLRP